MKVKTTFTCIIENVNVPNVEKYIWRSLSFSELKSGERFLAQIIVPKWGRGVEESESAIRLAKFPIVYQIFTLHVEEIFVKSGGEKYPHLPPPPPSPMTSLWCSTREFKIV